MIWAGKFDKLFFAPFLFLRKAFELRWWYKNTGSVIRVGRQMIYRQIQTRSVILCFNSLNCLLRKKSEPIECSQMICRICRQIWSAWQMICFSNSECNQFQGHSSNSTCYDCNKFWQITNVRLTSSAQQTTPEVFFPCVFIVILVLFYYNLF